MKVILVAYISMIIGILYINHIYAQESTTGDFGNGGGDFSPNAKLIAEDIIMYNETEIKDYPLTDLPVDDIKAVFTILDSGNLSKVLLNIPADQLKEIQNKLSSEEFNNILKRLPKDNENQISKKLVQINE